MSPKIKYDVTGVDSTGDFPTPKPGVYLCEIDVIEHKDSKAGNPMLEVQYVIVDGEFKNARLWDYIVLDGSADWKLRGFLEAVGLVKGSKEKGELDPDRLVGTRVTCQIKQETSEEYGTRSRVQRVVSANSKQPEVEEDLEDEAEEDLEDDVTYDDVMAMRKVELRDLVKENELGIRVTKQAKLNALRERVAEELGLTEEEDDEEDGEEDVEEVEVEDYAELSVGDLRAELQERGLETKGTKSALVKRLEKDDEDGDEPF